MNLIMAIITKVNIEKICIFSVLVEHAIALFRALPALFPSPTAPSKKLGNASEALLHVLQVRVCKQQLLNNRGVCPQKGLFEPPPGMLVFSVPLCYFIDRLALAFYFGPVFKKESLLRCLMVFLLYPLRHFSGFFLSSFYYPTEDPTIYVQKRPLSTLLLLFDGSRCLVTFGTTPITTFAKEDLCEGLLYLMAYYYTLHLTYPKCVATILSVIQTEILQDSIHDQDMTTSYKKAMAEWKAFIGM